MKIKNIFVDAGNSNNHLSFKKPFQLSLIDEDNNIFDSIVFNKLKITNMDAEYYAILNSVMYIIENKLNEHYNITIHSDNKNCVDLLSLNNFCKQYNIKLKWISRELNSKADLLTKSIPNKIFSNDYINHLINLKKTIER